MRKTCSVRFPSARGVRVRSRIRSSPPKSCRERLSKRGDAIQFWVEVRDRRVTHTRRTRPTRASVDASRDRSRPRASAGSAERGRADGFEGLAVCADSRRTFQRCGHYFHEFLRRSAVLLGARGHRGHQLRVLPAAELQAHARDGGHRGSVFGRFERTTRALLNRGPIRESRPRPLTGPVGSFSGARRRESRPRSLDEARREKNKSSG